jgi:AraC-like DNA-binding protein
MKTLTRKYKNIDKSSQILFEEKDSFKVLHLRNMSIDTKYFKHVLSDDYIQLYFTLSGHAVTAFNFEHCAVKIPEHVSNMVYIKGDTMKLFFELQPKTELVGVLISISYFHSLFSFDENFLINYKNFNIGKPIIEPKEINGNIQRILNQLTFNPTSSSLRSVYLKGKLYELLSYYFSNVTENNEEHCPYIASEEIVGKIKKAKEIIIDEMNDPPSLTELSQAVGLNLKKLKTEFKKIYGVPVFKFLLNYKMELAKKLLQEKDMNVNQLAVYLGYSTSSHFIAAFKRKFGITPKQYAKN